jgi:hypothetical protein
MLRMIHSSVRYVIFSFLLVYNFAAHGQQTINDHKIAHYMEEAKEHMDAGNYEEANLSFRKLLTVQNILPTEMCYYFAETLYQLHQYQNSKNFINKYLKLTGTSGPYYQKVLALNELVDEKFNEIKSCQFCDEKGYRLQECETCHGEGHLLQTCHHCKGKGLTACTACGTKGVKITVNAFKEKEYKSCPVCNSKGFITCPVCGGKTTEELVCNVCRGKGTNISNKICDHSPPTSNTSSMDLFPDN